MGETVLYVNGRFLPESQANVSALDRGFTLADGLFETMVAVQERVFRLDDHLSRLMKGADWLDLSLPTPDELAGAIRETLRRNGLPRSVARLTVTRGMDTGRGLSIPEGASPTVVVRVMTRQRLPSQNSGRSLTISTLRRDEASPLSQFKSLFYTQGIVARLKAQRSGADDALLLNTKGKVACATSSNLFLVRRDGTLVTPPPSDGALLGIARQTVMELARSLDISLAEDSIAPEELSEAEEVFLTNVVTGPVPVVSVDGRLIRGSEPGRVSLALATSYAAMVEGVEE
ncbi:MAG: aminotransferase class IV [Chloroflexi bacterium]|nr:aminotransferase class IV [Chloroflexota bacterium]